MLLQDLILFLYTK